MKEQILNPPFMDAPKINNRENRKIIYEKIESKIALVKKVWTEAKTLPIPSRNDTEKIDQTEEAKFQEIFQEILIRLPEGAAKFSRQQEIESSLKNEAHSRTRTKLQKEQSQLEENADLKFITTMRNGINKALTKRAEIRDLLKKGAIEEASNKVIPDEFKGKVLEVVIANFSINLIVSNPAFIQYFKDNQVEGFHFKNTVFSIIRGDNRSKLLSRIFGDKTSNNLAAKLNSEERKLVLNHEDFHSFINGFLQFFPTQSLDNIFLDSYFIKVLIKQYLGLKSTSSNKLLPPIIRKPAKRKLRYELRRIKKAINKFFDLGYEELLAELAASSGYRKGFPDHTYAIEIQARQNYLDFAKLSQNIEEGNPEINSIIESAKKNFNINAYREKCALLFKIVQDKAPHKMEDLEIAFALFRPSQIKHIEKLVKRWVSSC